MAASNESITDLYRQIINLQNHLADGVEQDFIRFALSQEECRLKWQTAEETRYKQQEEIVKLQRELTTSEDRLQVARRMIDKEKIKNRALLLENQALERQLIMLRDLLMPQRYKLNDETKGELEFLNSTIRGRKSSVAPLVGAKRRTTFEYERSYYSDVSCSYSEEDLDPLYLRSVDKWKTNRPSLSSSSTNKQQRTSQFSENNRSIINYGNRVSIPAVVQPARASVGADALRTLIENKNEEMRTPAPPSPRSIPESPKEEMQTPKLHQPLKSMTEPTGPQLLGSSPSVQSEEQTSEQDLKVDQAGLSPELGLAFDAAKEINNQQHSFMEKIVIKPEHCGYCGKKLKFGKMAFKCRECKAMAHPQCKEHLPLPCIPSGFTPNLMKGVTGSIADYAPSRSPMVPSIVIHCINEIEARGLSEVGIYRISGSAKDVQILKEQFLRGRGAPNLSKYDIHVVCGVLKSFFRSLNDPLITQGLWHDFARAAEEPDPADCIASLYQAVSELPQPNRDTLAYLMLHLQRVACCEDCKMPMDNLAKVFGPTVLGYPWTDLSASTVLKDTKKQQMIIEALMKIPSEYWNSFVKVDSSRQLVSPGTGGPTSPSGNFRTPLRENIPEQRQPRSWKKFFNMVYTPQ